MKWKHRVHLLSAVLSADFILLAYLICLLAAPVTVREASAPEGTFEPEKYLALTFDDGPHPVHTPVLLDGLKERGVPATFFLMGSCIPGNEALVKRMQEEGHLIGNHSYNHVRLTKAGPAAVCEAVDRTSGHYGLPTSIYASALRRLERGAGVSVRHDDSPLVCGFPGLEAQKPEAYRKEGLERS